MLKVIEILAESKTSWEDAAQQAVNEANRSIRNVKSIHLDNINATVENGKILSYRINARLAFTLEKHG